MESTQTFEAYLSNKKINPNKFKSNEPLLFDDLKEIFDQMHPKSFTQQKLFLINPLRLKYILEEDKEAPTPSKSKTTFKPRVGK